jgi:hypothetical protein
MCRTAALGGSGAGEAAGSILLLVSLLYWGTQF